MKTALLLAASVLLGACAANTQPVPDSTDGAKPAETPATSDGNEPAGSVVATDDPTSGDSGAPGDAKSADAAVANAPPEPGFLADGGADPCVATTASANQCAFFGLGNVWSAIGCSASPEFLSNKHVSVRPDGRDRCTERLTTTGEPLLCCPA